jgi:hypothetical protein
LAKRSGALLECVSVGIVESQHKQQEWLFSKFFIIEGNVCRKWLHITSGKRGAIGLCPYLKPCGDLFLIEWLQSDSCRSKGNPGTIGNRGATGNDGGYRSIQTGLSFLECLHAQEEVILRDSSGLQELVKSVKYQDREKAVT